MGDVGRVATLTTSFVATCLGASLDSTVAEIEDCFVSFCGGPCAINKQMGRGSPSPKIWVLLNQCDCLIEKLICIFIHSVPPFTKYRSVGIGLV